MRIAHLPFQLRAGNQRRHRIDHQHVDRIAANQGIGDIQRVFAAVGLRDQQIGGIDADLGRIARIDRMFGVDDGAFAAGALRIGDHMQTDGGFAGGFGTENFHDPPARHAADAERQVERQRSGADGGDIPGISRRIAEAHDRPLAEFLFDLGDGDFKILRAFCIFHILGHNFLPVVFKVFTVIQALSAAPSTPRTVRIRYPGL
ncbi:hypothetical protein SDC9_70978 [bioreactor metagenome]|uniref:Uncharacterized protein n=1 Tax=bioreactor metagenome TaxID=1076179 RepID=A0A644Y7G7_9ZZZZ